MPKLHWPHLRPYYLCALLGVGLFLLLNPSLLTAQTEEEESSLNESVSLEQLQLFGLIYQRIMDGYVDEIGSEELFENAIKGMINELDPHSSFIKAKEFEDVQISTSGKFGGLGIVVGMEDGLLRVISPIEDTPADRAGVEAGDLIILIDDKRVKGMTIDQAVDRMRGEVGTKIEITVVREGKANPLKFNIIRDEIKLTSVRSEMLSADLGYLRISSFNLETTNQVKEELDKLAEQAKEKDTQLNGLIIDLRNNPGGTLKTAVEVTDLFLNKGVIVSTKARSKEIQSSFSAKEGDVLEGKPVVILVNNGSASGSEILAGALKDHNRALILGIKTFGKASVQTIMPLPEGNALKLTTARYYTPNGTSIQSNGIEPDIYIPLGNLTISEADLQFREENLRGNLGEKEAEEQETDIDKPATEQETENDANAAQEILENHSNEDEETDASVQGSEGNEKIVEDYQLHVATDIIKALAISHLIKPSR